MRSKIASGFLFATAALALVAGATESRAQDACSAGASVIISRSTGGTCGDALSPDEVFTITYRITNASVIDDAGSPNDGDFVDATIAAGESFDATLSQQTSGQGDPELAVLEFIPVCPAGSVGGTKNPGEECSPGECGTGTCGCESAQPGVTCSANGANHVDIDLGSDVEFTEDEQVEIATIRVRSIGTVPAATCGEYFTRFDGDGDVLFTDDVDCESEVSAGAQASADLHAPECASDDDCDECEVCADLATDPHCEPADAGTPCSPDAEECTDDECDGDGNCEHVENDDNCDDEDNCTADTCDAQTGCSYEDICVGGAICRSPGYWATHSGTEKSPKSINVGQLVIDTVGPIEVCGQVITDTSADGSVEGLGLDSNLEGLCMRAKGVKQRQLYRQLVAAAFNCAVTGGDCDGIVAPLIDVSFSDCSDLCAGTPVMDGPTEGECIHELDCFNNGGQIIEGDCVFGTCAEEDDVYCGGDAGDCPLFEDQPQECVPFPGNCHDQELCNEDLEICPKGGPASSSAACREARGNDCTIDECAP